MSKMDNKAAALFERSSRNDFVEAFEEREVAQESPNFRQEFIAASLSKEEDNAIQLLLYDEFTPNNEESVIAVDYKTLSILTQQIHAIDRQSILLHGERIQGAQDLLKKYKEGSFTSWLLLTYGNRQTPYRMLRFYELFQEIERKDRPLLEKMPKKAAYSLAMRDGDLNKKIEIIRDHYHEEPAQILQAIRAILPLSEGDRRVKHKCNDEVILRTIEDGIRTLKKRKNELSDSTKKKLMALGREIEALFAP